MPLSPDRLPFYRKRNHEPAPFESDEYFDTLRAAIRKEVQQSGEGEIYFDDLSQVVNVTPFENKPITLAQLIASWQPKLADKLGIPILSENQPVRSVFELSTKEMKAVALANIEPTANLIECIIGGRPYHITGVYLRQNVERGTEIALALISDLRFNIGTVEEYLTSGKEIRIKGEKQVQKVSIAR